jgi:molecular chaperone GrpE
MDEESKQSDEQPQDEKHSADGPLHKEHKKEKLHKLHEQIDNLQAQKDELFAKLQRVSADYANYQKRSAKQISESIVYEKELIIKSILPVLDNLEHTLGSAEGTEGIENLRKGVKIICDQMLSILKGYGIEQIDCVGQKFDPSCHEAIMQRTEPGREDAVILEEFQKGYRLGEKVLRPGKVIVNKKPANNEDLTRQDGEIDQSPDGD